jgi:hypothetical protein
MTTRHQLCCACLLALLICQGSPGADKPPPDKNAESVNQAL